MLILGNILGIPLFLRHIVRGYLPDLRKTKQKRSRIRCGDGDDEEVRLINFELSPGAAIPMISYKKMKSRGILVFVVVSALAFLSIFPTWKFSERTNVLREKNPLWNYAVKPTSSSLTEALRGEGLIFQTGRGAEADPDGICYGDFGSDEYWVVGYDPTTEEVYASAWIIGTNWIGHLQAQRRFARIKEILEDTTENKQ